MSEYKKCPYCGGQILAVAKKCKYCREWLIDSPRKTQSKIDNGIPRNETSSTEDKILLKQSDVKEMCIKTHEPTTLQKIMQVYWFIPKKNLLDEFVIKEGVLTVTTLGGNSLSSPIDEIDVGYAVDNYERKQYTLKHNDEKLSFNEMPGMLSDDEWNEIMKTLESFPKYGLSKIGKANKALGWVVKVMKFLAD